MVVNQFHVYKGTVCLFVCLSVCMSLCLSLFLPVCLYVWLHLKKIYCWKILLQLPGLSCKTVLPSRSFALLPPRNFTIFGQLPLEYYTQIAKNEKIKLLNCSKFSVSNMLPSVRMPYTNESKCNNDVSQNNPIENWFLSTLIL